MARESRTHKSKAKVTLVEPEPQRRTQRVSDEVPQKSYRHVKQTPSSTQRPLRETPVNIAPKANKSKQKVSIAGVFKKQHKVKSGRVNKKQQRRETTPELDLVGDIQDGINAARTHLSTQAKATFTSIHGTFNAKLEAIHEEDTAFMQHVSEVASKLSTPLVGEKIETVIRLDGKRVAEIVEIGKRVEAFKELIETEEENLKQAWKEWDEVQEEYIKLGIDVFGAKVFGEPEGEGRGYREEMELLELEHDTRVAELDEEIMEIGDDALSQMKASEKELDTATRKEQARLLQALL